MKDLAFFSSKNLKVVGATAKEKNNIIPKIIDVKYRINCSIIKRLLQNPQNAADLCIDLYADQHFCVQV